MKTAFILFALVVTSAASAQGFDEKKAAAEQARASNELNQRFADAAVKINANNRSMVSRVPRGATLTKCLSLDAVMWGKRGGCSLVSTSWSGYPVETCGSTVYYNRMQEMEAQLPPKIVQCQYHVASTGKDCAYYANASLKHECY